MKFLIKPLLFSAVLASGMAHAGVLNERTQYFNAPAHCQGALPNFEGSLRKRPLALQNEGTGNAFVTCAIPTQDNVRSLEIYMSSHDGNEATVSCTLVTSYKGGSNAYLPASTVVPSDGRYARVMWSASDFPGTPGFFPSAFVSVSCNLPAGTGLNDFRLYYAED